MNQTPYFSLFLDDGINKPDFSHHDGILTQMLIDGVKDICFTHDKMVVYFTSYEAMQEAAKLTNWTILTQENFYSLLVTQVNGASNQKFIYCMKDTNRLRNGSFYTTFSIEIDQKFQIE